MNRRTCLVHQNRPTNLLCFSVSCVNQSPICEICAYQNHSSHQVVRVDQLTKLINRFSAGKGEKGNMRDEKQQNQAERISRVSSVEHSCNRLQDTLGKVGDCGNYLGSVARQCQEAERVLMGSIKALDAYINEDLTKHIQSLVMKNQHKKMEEIIKMGRFLMSPIVDSEDKICHILNTVQEKVEFSVNNLKQDIEKAFTLFFHEIDKCQIGNWENIISPNEELQIFPMKDQENYKYKRKGLPKIRRQAAQKSTREYEFLTESFEEELNIMMKQIFETSTLKQTQQISLLSMPTKSNLTKFIVCKQDTSKIISKNEVMMAIERLQEMEETEQTLREFVIEGESYFDTECLEKLAAYFPKLNKINYVWNFQECGLQLQQQQCFFTKERKLNKPLQNFKMNQHLLDTFGSFKDLENIQIHKLNRFVKGGLKIVNQRIKHLTLGEYLQRGQADPIPPNVVDQSIRVAGLITLNLFNIKSIEIEFINKIVTPNLASLRNLWISQCSYIDAILFQIIKISKLTTIILDQVKNIDHTIFVPQSLETLIVDNCSFRTGLALAGLDRAIKLTNFSVFDSYFGDMTKTVGESLVRQIATIAASSCIRYLNFGECKSVTGECLAFLEKFTCLEDLCIDNTQIYLNQFLRHPRILRRLRKLGIVGLKGNRPDILNAPILQYSEYPIPEILTESQKLQIISLSFEQIFDFFPIQAFLHLQHISLALINDREEGKNSIFDKFVAKLKKIGKNVRVIEVA